MKSAESVVFEILREIHRLGPLRKGALIVARVHPDLATFLEQERSGLLEGAGVTIPGRIEVAADPSLRHGQFGLTIREPD